LTFNCNVLLAINAWFWNRPDTGSGQYTRRLVEALLARDAAPRITLVAPGDWEIEPPQGANVVRVGRPGRGHLSKAWFEQIGFPRVCQRLGADLAHVPYWAAPLRSRTPVVVTVHDLVPLLLPEYRGGALARLYTGLVAATARGAAAVLTDSGASQRDIIHHLRLDESRVYAVPLAAGPEYHPSPAGLPDTDIARKYDLPPRYVLYLGGYDVRKNVGTLLQAYTYVRGGVSDACPLVLAGRLPERASVRFPDVRAQIERQGLDDVVRLIGEVDEADKPGLYRGAEVFVYPSRYEGFGLPPLEAMSCGTPVVVAESSSLPEVVGGAGFLVAPDDARHMAGAILALLMQDDLAREMSRRGIEQAARFGWARTAAETQAVYQRALS
jgi:glycosyltransferase involved in cell wall biosynthesis